MHTFSVRSPNYIAIHYLSNPLIATVPFQNFADMFSTGTIFLYSRTMNTSMYEL